MLACPPCLRRREWLTRGWGSRLGGFQKLIRGNQLVASTMDKSDLVILWRGRRELVPTDAPRIGGAYLRWEEPVKSMTLLPVCFRRASDFAGRDCGCRSASPPDPSGLGK